MFKRTIIIIPARKGSTGLPGKNLKVINGKPLINHTFEFVRNHLRKLPVIISTDSEDVLAEAQKYGFSDYDLRPESLSSSSAKTIDVVKFELNKIDHADIDYVLLLQPTSPLRTAEDVQNLSRMMKEKPDKNIVSVSKVDEPHPHKMFTNQQGTITPLIKNSTDLPRQSLPEVFFLNGLYYLVKKDDLLTFNTFTPPNSQPYIIDQRRSININNQTDFDLCELMFRDISNV